MNTLIMMKGLPGSGKSFAAKKIVDDSRGEHKRVNRDDLRAMIDNGRWSRKNEEFVRKIRDLIIIEALNSCHDVIVDDTNLEPSLEVHFRQIAKEHDANFQIIDLTSIDKDLCIKRDLTRPNSVGSKVINRMYNQYIAHKETPKYIEGAPDAIICDLDGTLALFGKENPYDRDFTKDNLNVKVADILWTYYTQAESGLNIILISGRQDKAREQTEEWLRKYQIPYNALYMRETEDIRKDAIVKEEIYEERIKHKFNVLFVLDDRDQVVQMWRNLGLTCLQVAPGDF